MPESGGPARDDLIRAFLDGAGWAAATRAPLAADASFRRYDRVTDGDRRAVLMDAPPDKEDVRPYALVARHLNALGISAPRILAEDIGNGLLLLEDFGDSTYTRLLAGGADETALYALAVDVLVALHRRPEAEALPAGLPAYDTERLIDEACLLTDWYMPAVLGAPTPAPVRAAYVAIWRRALPVAGAGPRTLVLRDYHVDNLMLLDGRQGIAACGQLDFQDAVAGHPAYDLMSLLEDARRDIDPALAAAMRARYLDAFPDLDRAAFDAAYAVLGATRHAKVIGIFTRLCLRDGKPDYLVHIPRVWRLLEGAVRHPLLAPLARWLAIHVATDRREIPPCPAAAPQ
ncbi:MAG: phosphotransferase [Hyphomicrobiales bacterium]|nr:phosphotransferase [Hyphomicrobiales bacterium]MCP5370393.1 phosphotransferase [Hyphomicrobiales bacterium]